MKSKLGKIVVAIMMGAILAGLGLALMVRGAQVIRDRHWTMTSESSRTVFLGPLGIWGEKGVFVERWEGGDAERAGAALLCLGQMVVLWGTAFFTGAAYSAPTGRPGWRSVVSTILWLLALVLFLPPWTAAENPRAAWFWGTVTVWVVAIFVLTGRPEPRKKAAVGVVLFFATLLSSFLLELQRSDAPLFGMLAALFTLGHALYLYPPWRRLAVAASTGRPQGSAISSP